MGEVRPQFGGDPTEAQCDEPSNRWVAPHGDQNFGDDVGDGGLDEVARLGAGQFCESERYRVAIANANPHSSGLALVGQAERFERDRIPVRFCDVGDVVVCGGLAVGYRDA